MRVVSLAASAVVIGGACDLGVDPVVYMGAGGSLSVADVDADGDLDIATADCNNRVVALENEGSGTFAPDTGAQYCASDLVLGDFNADGFADRLVVDRQIGGVYLFLNNGTGQYINPTFHRSVISGHVVRAAAVGDFNNDGHEDFVYQGAGSSQGLAVSLGVGTGQWFDFKGTYSDGSPPYTYVASTLVAEDLNADGNLDLVSTGNVDDYVGLVTVAFGDGTGAFPEAGSFPITLGRDAQARGIVIKDLDGDSLVDIAATSTYVDVYDGQAKYCLALLPGNGAGGFDPPTCVLARENDRGFLGGDDTAVDIDADGNLDLVTSRGVLFGDGAGSFPRWRGLATGTDAAVGDFDGDGRPDVAISQSGDARAVHVFRNDLEPPAGG